jgi:hypothetical protein
MSPIYIHIAELEESERSQGNYSLVTSVYVKILDNT